MVVRVIVVAGLRTGGRVLNALAHKKSSISTTSPERPQAKPDRFFTLSKTIILTIQQTVPRFVRKASKSGVK